MYKLGIGYGICAMSYAMGKLVLPLIKGKNVTKEDVIATVCMVAVVGIAASELL